jgi:PAP2 superfamily
MAAMQPASQNRCMVRTWLSRSHSGTREIAGLVLLYGLYEVVRGAGGENVQLALRNTADIVAVEQAVGIYVEQGVQSAFEAIPFAPAVLGLAYVLLHFVGTAVALVWVHRRHPDRFPIVRTTFVAATALALVGYVFFPAAPPRLADLGFSDTVTRSTGLDLSSDLLGALYNPFAAVPSLHFGYALIVGVVLAVVAKGRLWRIAGALYPAAMLTIIVATGNHFIVDAVLGGLVVVIGWLAARALVTPSGEPVRAARVAPCASRA